MRSNFALVVKLLSLFFIPFILGGGLVFFGINQKVIFLLVVPVIFILLASFLLELGKNAKENFFKYDQVFEEMGFSKKTFFFILKSYEKDFQGITLRVFYGPGRGAYASRFSLTAKIQPARNLALGFSRPLNAGNLPEVPGLTLPVNNLERLKAFGSDIDWLRGFLQQEANLEAVRKIFANQGQQDSFVLNNGWLWVRIIFQQIDPSAIKNLVSGVETLIASLRQA